MREATGDMEMAARQPLGERSNDRVSHVAAPSLERAGLAFPVVLFTNSTVMGGMEEHVLQLGRGLVARGFTVAVICSRHDAIRPLREGLAAAGVDVFALTHRQASPLTMLPRVVALARILRRYPGSVLHMHFTGHTGGDLLTIAARTAGVRAIVRSVHLPPVQAQAVTERDRFTVRLRDRQLARIICVSDQTRREHLRILGRDAQKCVVVHNGVDLLRFAPDVAPVDVRTEFGFESGAPIIGTVARLGEARKGIDHFLNAAAVVARRYPATRYLVVGEGPLRPALERQAAALGLGRKVAFTGHRTDVPALLAAMTIFASPSLWEACQYNLLEAMATARPVVSTPTGVAPEVVIAGGTGALVPISDSEALAAALLEMLADPERAREMGRRGRDLIESRFSVEAMLDGIVGVYRGVI
jgi:glycosyltransferase involved in cell wall biosynthesis